jgi:hypothetical protein
MVLGLPLKTRLRSGIHFRSRQATAQVAPRRHVVEFYDLDVQEQGLERTTRNNAEWDWPPSPGLMNRDECGSPLDLRRPVSISGDR